MNKKTNLTESQIDRVMKRTKFVKQAIAVSNGRQFDSYNAYATFLAKLLSEYERMEAAHNYKSGGETEEFIPPKPVSRQIFTRNESYRALAKAAYAGQKVKGSLSIKNPRTPAEFNALLVQNGFEISELNAEIGRLKEQLKQASLTQQHKLETEDEGEYTKTLRLEKSKTTQAIINLLRWADGLLEFDDGCVIDKGARGDKSIVVERHLLKHSEHIISAALMGLSVK